MSFRNVISAPTLDELESSDLPLPLTSAAPLGTPSSTAFPTADPELVQLARALRHDPDLIFEFVHNNIVTLPQYGSLKGPLGTLIDGCGTAFDQAELMAVLLELSGVTPLKFVVGRITVTAAQVTAWLDSDVSIGSVSAILSTGGFNPNNYTYNNGNFASARIGWAWVKATIGGTAYVFDPATKAYSRKPGESDIGGVLSYSRATFLATAGSGATINPNDIINVNRGNIQTSIADYASNLITELETEPYWAAGPDDILGGASIVPLPINTQRRNPTLSYAVSSTDYDSVPSSVRTTLQVQVKVGTAPPVTVTFTSADIYGRRLSLFFNASIRPVLALDGIVRLTGPVAVVGNLVTLTFSINHPYPGSLGDQSGPQDVRASVGGAFVISNGWGPVGRGMIDRHRQILAKNTAANPGNPTAEPVLGESLAMLGYTWLAQVARTQHLVDRLGNTSTVYQHAVGIVGMSALLPPPNPQVTGPYVDLPFNVLGVVQRTGRISGNGFTEQENAALFTLSQLSSVLESGSIEQTQPGVLAVSTVKLLDVAAGLPQTIYDLDSVGVFDEVRDDLTNYTTTFLDGLRTSISGGARVILHQDGQIQQNLWEGFGYFQIKIDSSGTSIGAIISGGYSGGFPTVDVPATTVNLNAGEQLLRQSLSEVSTRLGLGGGDSYNLYPVGGDPLNLVTGAYVYSFDDLTVGNGAFPYTLAFQRSYDSGRAGAGTTLGPGWRHGFDLSVVRDSDGFEGMAATSPASGATSIAAIYVLLDLLKEAGPPLSHIVFASVVADYWMEQLTGNALRVTRPGAVESFIRLADGTWNRPVGSSSALSGAPGGPYTLHTGDGAVLQFAAATFSQAGHITSWESAGGAEVDFTYTAGKLTSVSTNLGRTLTLGYTGDLLTSVSDGNGRSVGFIYAAGRLERVTDPLTNETRYTYDTAGRLKEIFYPAFPTDAFLTNTYDDLGQVVEQRDGNGNLTTVYAAGRRMELAEPSGSRHVWYFDPLGKPVLDVQDYGYNENGTLRLNRQTAMSYDGQSRLTSMTLPEGDRTETTYDQYANPKKVTRYPKPGSSFSPLVQEFTYSTPIAARANFLRLASAKDARGNTTDYEYQPITGNLVLMRQPAVTKPGVPGTTEPEATYAYTTVGLLQQETDPEGRVTTYGYDGAGNLTARTVNAGTGQLNLKTTWTYDAVGNALTTVSPRGNETGADPATFTITSTYDAKRRLTQTAPGAGGRTDYSYDADDRVIQVRRLIKTASGGNPAVLQRTNTSYTKTGKVFRITDADLVRSTYAYDEADRVRTITSSSGRFVIFAYDALSRVGIITDSLLTPHDPTITEDRGAVTRERRSYSANGRLASVWDGNDNQTRFIYDAFDRLFRIDYPDTTALDQFSYDANGNTTQRRTRAGLAIDFTYDALNRVTTRAVPANVNAAAVTYAYGYDLSGRLLQLGKSTDTAPLLYQYDGAGRLISETDAAGRVVTSTLDADGNRVALTWPGTGGQATFDYDGLSRLFRVREASQQIAFYGFDLMSRRTSALYSNAVQTNWTWRLNSTVERVEHVLPGGGGVAFDYRYNTENAVSARLVSDATYLPGSSNPALAPGVRGYAVNGLNQYTAVAGVPFGYDDDGNLTGDGVWSYGYDPEGRLVSATKAGTVLGFGYDAAGRRRSRTLNGATTEVLWSGEQEVAEYNGATGALVRRFVWGSLGPDEILAVIGVTGSLSARRKFHHADGLGSVVAVTNYLAAVEEKHAYTPYGVGDANTGTAWRFTGRRLDGETGLYYLRARDYAPLIGRFLQPDPIGIEGGINLYAYVGNDPLNATDPSGLWTLQIGGSFYYNIGWFGGQISLGIVADSQGNAGFFGSATAGPGIGLGFKFAASGAVTNAPEIFNLQGQGSNLSIVGGAGAAGSFDFGRFDSDGRRYRSIGASIGYGGGAAVSAGPSYTHIIPQVVWNSSRSTSPVQMAPSNIYIGAATGRK
jgi:RHS repeat-associated protein